MALALILLVVSGILVALAIKVVPEQNAWVVERQGKYLRTLAPGLNLLLPFLDQVAYKHSLLEARLEVPGKLCTTQDQAEFQVECILYYQVADALRASYGSANYTEALMQLAQTSLREVIGKLEKGGQFFKERGLIVAQVMEIINDEAALNLGLKVLRLEIKD